MEKFYKLKKPNGKCPKGIRREMFGYAPVVLIVQDDVECRVFWMDPTSTEEGQRVFNDHLEELPEKVIPITKKYFEKLTTPIC